MLKRKTIEFKNVINSNSDHVIQKAVKPFKNPTNKKVPIWDAGNNWCRSDIIQAEAFATHLKERFTPFPSNEDESDVLQFVEAFCAMSLPIRHITPNEVHEKIQKLNNRKSIGYDIIDARVCKALPRKAVLCLT